MKRFIAYFLLLILLLNLTACGKSSASVPAEKPAESKNENTAVTNEKEKATEPKADEVVKSDLLPYSYKVPGYDIVVDVPNYQEIELGFTKLFIVHGKKFVAITADKHETTSVNTLEEAHNAAIGVMVGNTWDYGMIVSVDITESTTTTVNGVDVLRYTGVANVSEDYIEKDVTIPHYAVGFSFIMDGIPCNVCAVVLDPAQEAAMIEEMTTIIDAMIPTLRDKR